MSHLTDSTSSDILALDESATQILEFIRIGAFEEAENLVTKSNFFSLTVPADLRTEWVTYIMQQLYVFLPYASSANWIDMAPELALNRNSFKIRRIFCISSCFRILNACHAALEVSLLAHCFCQSNHTEWHELYLACMKDDAFELASECLGHAIRSLAGQHSNPFELADPTEQKALLTLWSQRAHLFEMLHRPSDAIAALNVYRGLASAFQQTPEQLPVIATVPVFNSFVEQSQRALEVLRNSRSRLHYVSPSKSK